MSLRTIGRILEPVPHQQSSNLRPVKRLPVSFACGFSMHRRARLEQRLSLARFRTATTENPLPSRLSHSAKADRNRFIALYMTIALGLLAAAGMLVYEARATPACVCNRR